MNADPSSEWNRLRKAATHPGSIEENIEKARQMAILSGEFGEGPIRERFNYIWGIILDKRDVFYAVLL